MPASKKALRQASRGNGDLPRNPADLKKRAQEATEASQEPAQLELVPEPPPVEAPAPAQSAGGIVITIKSNKLKESTGKGRAGKPPVYRSVTGKDAGGKTYWLALEMEEANPQKGEQWVVEGRERKSFGKDDDPLHPIDVTSIVPYDEAVAAISAESPQVSSAPAEALVDMKAMLNKYNVCGVLQALTDALKEE